MKAVLELLHLLSELLDHSLLLEGLFLLLIELLDHSLLLEDLFFLLREDISQADERGS